MAKTYSHEGVPELIAAIGSLVLIVVTLLLSNMDPSKGLRCLQEAGCTEIQVQSWAPLACGSDVYSQHFQAVSPAGKLTTGVVCDGVLLKACTVRF